MGAHLGRLGAILGVLEPCWHVLGASWGHLGPSWEQSWASRSALKRAGSAAGPPAPPRSPHGGMSLGRPGAWNPGYIYIYIYIYTHMRVGASACVFGRRRRATAQVDHISLYNFGPLHCDMMSKAFGGLECAGFRGAFTSGVGRKVRLLGEYTEAC